MIDGEDLTPGLDFRESQLLQVRVYYSQVDLLNFSDGNGLKQVGPTLRTENDRLLGWFPDHHGRKNLVLDDENDLATIFK